MHAAFISRAGLNVVVVPFVQQSIPYLHSLQDCYELNVHKFTVWYQHLQDHSYIHGCTALNRDYIILYVKLYSKLQSDKIQSLLEPLRIHCLQMYVSQRLPH